MLNNYKIEVDNSKQLKDNAMLNCSMELSLLNNLLRENLITEAEHIEIKRKILKEYKLVKYKSKFHFWLNLLIQEKSPVNKGFFFFFCCDFA